MLLNNVSVNAQNMNPKDTDRYKIIKKIEIRGNKRISDAAIKSAISIMEGDYYSSETVSRDVESIWSLGFFDNIEVAVEPFEKGIKLIFIVFERPVIKNITFIGNEHISTKKLRETIDLFENQDLKHYILKLNEDKIIKLYHDKGFLFAEVKTEEKSENGQIDIIFHIKEGEKVRIASIDFKGNASIESKKLLKVMKTRPAHFPSFIFHGLFKNDLFESDIEAVKTYYRQKGWLDADVNWKIDYNADKTSMFITIIVKEEERYFIDAINIKGQTIFSEKELKDHLQLVEGGPLLLELLEKDIFQIRLMYGEQGYINVQVDEKHIFNPDSTTTNIVYNIKENDRVFIEKIKITGNDKTKDNVIRRQLTFYPGEHVNVTKIRDSQQKLINTGYFDMESGAPTNITFEPGSKPDTQNIVIDVKEGRSGMLRFGGGFGANVGLFGDISYTDRNFDILDIPKDLQDFLDGNAFRGGGQIFNIRIAPGLERQEASISLQNPSVFDSNYSAGASLFTFGRRREDFDEKRKGGRLNVGKRITNNLVVGLTPGFEVITIDDIDEGTVDDDNTDRTQQVDDRAPQDVFDVEGDNAKLGVEIKATLDTRDNPFLPSKGYTLQSSFEVAGLDVDIIKFILGGMKYNTIYTSPKRGKHTLSYGGTLGLVETTSGEDVPIFERFFAGGQGSIRGFRFRGASPVEDGQQVGGDILLLGTLEYNFPIIKNFLRGVTFIDTGKADKDISDINFDNFRLSTGLGVRLSIPIFGRAVISLDWGFPLVQQDDDELQNFSFNIGSGSGF